MQEPEKHTEKVTILNPCPASNLPKPTLLYCCEVLIDFRTCLFPAPIHCNDIKVISKLEAKIDKSCGCKVLIGGILHKTIIYKSKDSHCETREYVKHKDIPFSCYVDIDCASQGDTFKIVGHDIICEFSELRKVKNGCCIKTIFIEKDIIKIAVQSN